MTDHPTVRDCATCSQYVLDADGEISTYPAPDGRGGVIELKMTRADAGQRPPCGTCPKIEEGMVAEPQPEENDFAPWFWECRQLYREGRAVGDFGKPDPLMRQIFAEFSDAERRQEQYALVQMVSLAVARAARK